MANGTLTVFTQLMKRDLLGFWREFPTKLLDTCILFLTNVIVFCYFLPAAGLDKSYAPFFLIGSIASFGIIEVVGKVGAFLADLEGDCAISHTMILPIKSRYVFCYIAVFWALTSLFLSIPLFPLGKILLFNLFNLAEISYFKLIIMFISSSIFCGT